MDIKPPWCFLLVPYVSFRVDHTSKKKSQNIKETLLYACRDNLSGHKGCRRSKACPPFPPKENCCILLLHSRYPVNKEIPMRKNSSKPQVHYVSSVCILSFPVSSITRGQNPPCRRLKTQNTPSMLSLQMLGSKLNGERR